MKNENTGDGMVDIMSQLHQYIPAVEHTKHVLIESTREIFKVQQDIIHKVLFGGDQLPEEEQQRG